MTLQTAKREIQQMLADPWVDQEYLKKHEVNTDYLKCTNDTEKFETVTLALEITMYYYRMLANVVIDKLDTWSKEEIKDLINFHVTKLKMNWVNDIYEYSSLDKANREDSISKEAGIIKMKSIQDQERRLLNDLDDLPW